MTKQLFFNSAKFFALAVFCFALCAGQIFAQSTVTGGIRGKVVDAQGAGRGAHKRLFELFPYGYVKQSCRIAGMKRPRAWSTG